MSYRKAYPNDPLGELVRMESGAFREDIRQSQGRDPSTHKGKRKKYDSVYKKTVKGMSKQKLKELQKALARRRSKAYKENWKRHKPEGAY